MRRFLVSAVLLIVGLVVGVSAATYGLTGARIKRTWSLAVEAPRIPSDSESLARGRHLALGVANCAHCHGDDLGGRDYIDGGLLGHLYTANLTKGRGGVGAMSTSDWTKAIRHGVGRDGRSLWFMPAETFRVMSDEDLGSLIAYLQSLPPVDRELPSSQIGALGRMLYVAGKFPFLTAELVNHEQRAPARVERAITPEYGYYLARLGGCIGCHGRALTGGRVPGAPPSIPPASNLTPAGLAHYSEESFVRALREGIKPDGTRIDPFMPLDAIRRWTDEERRAVWAYLRTVETTDD
jgi:mono/diheme cytochrome c family protein